MMGKTNWIRLRSPHDHESDKARYMFCMSGVFFVLILFQFNSYLYSSDSTHQIINSSYCVVRKARARMHKILPHQLMMMVPPVASMLPFPTLAGCLTLTVSLAVQVPFQPRLAMVQSGKQAPFLIWLSDAADCEFVWGSKYPSSLDY